MKGLTRIRKWVGVVDLFHDLFVYISLLIVGSMTFACVMLSFQAFKETRKDDGFLETSNLAFLTAAATAAIAFTYAPLIEIKGRWVVVRAGEFTALGSILFLGASVLRFADVNRDRLPAAARPLDVRLGAFFGTVCWVGFVTGTILSFSGLFLLTYILAGRVCVPEGAPHLTDGLHGETPHHEPERRAGG